MHPYKLYERYRELQRYIGWTEDDGHRVRELTPIVSQHFTPLIDDFYVAIQKNLTTAKVITGGEQQIQRLKGTLVKWLEELFAGTYDQEYVLRRWKVGLKHVEIGLEQIYTNAALSRLRNQLLARLPRERFRDDEQMFLCRASLNKLLDLDLAIIEEAYRTEQQRRLQQVERLATIGQVAGGVAHELRNPLNVIKTSVYFLQHAKKITAEKSAVHLDRIDRQATMADAVISALNNFARLPVPEMKPSELRTLVQQVLDVEPLPSNLQLSMDFPGSLPKVLGDSQQLLIVISNLIRNARDAMPDGGRLTIEGRTVGDEVELQVTDTGNGIPTENLTRIMEPLFSTKARGIGLGLAISRAILEKHQGELRVQSIPGEGARFIVRLKAAEPQIHSNLG
jgi:signal transduction histidine kinase